MPCADSLLRCAWDSQCCLGLKPYWPWWRPSRWWWPPARFDGVTLFWPPTFSWLICRELRQARQIDIEAADPISTHMARDAPVAPTGTTVIEVRLASSVDDVLAGDQVRLVSAVGCEGADCTLAENATVMNVGKPDAIGALGGNDRLVSFAMPPEAAAKVMELQQAGAIMAVVR